MYSSAFYVLASFATVLRVATSSKREAKGGAEGGGAPTEYAAFRRSFLLVTLLALFSDWLQGPYVYQLYSDYGFSQGEIAQLFVVGFLSSMVAGTVAGAAADKYGRRRMCTAFAILYIVSCLTKIFPVYSILMLGRLTGGIATSLLFSVFESWVTLGYMTFGNGVVAVLAGFIANFAVTKYATSLAPFVFALLPLSLVLVLSLGWPENYGDANGSLNGSLSRAWSSIQYDHRILFLGLGQSLFEAAMYCFVFFWTPALLEADHDNAPGENLGLIFSSFMVCVTLGSMCFEKLSEKLDSFDVPLVVHLVASVGSGMTILALNYSGAATFASFLVFEMSVGMFYPAYGVIKSKVVAEDVRSTVMNFFRVPLNAFVAMLLLNVSRFTTSGMLVFIFFMHLAAGLSFLWARHLSNSSAARKEDGFELLPQGMEAEP